MSELEEHKGPFRTPGELWKAAPRLPRLFEAILSDSTYTSISPAFACLSRLCAEPLHLPRAGSPTVINIQLAFPLHTQTPALSAFSNPIQTKVIFALAFGFTQRQLLGLQILPFISIYYWTAEKPRTWVAVTRSLIFKVKLTSQWGICTGAGRRHFWERCYWWFSSGPIGGGEGCAALK